MHAGISLRVREDWMSFCIGMYKDVQKCVLEDLIILESNSEIFYIIIKIFQRF